MRPEQLAALGGGGATEGRQAALSSWDLTTDTSDRLLRVRAAPDPPREALEEEKEDRSMKGVRYRAVTCHTEGEMRQEASFSETSALTKHSPTDPE